MHVNNLSVCLSGKSLLGPLQAAASPDFLIFLNSLNFLRILF
jgi:hypothetical protein